jgi:hypothetical protein
VDPIACTLTGDELPRRMAEIRALARAALISVERGEARATLHFRAGAATREELERIVAAESRCCSFLELRLSDRRAALRLEIAAPPGAEPVLHELVDQFAAGAVPGSL